MRLSMNVDSKSSHIGLNQNISTVKYIFLYIEGLTVNHLTIVQHYTILHSLHYQLLNEILSYF